MECVCCFVVAVVMILHEKVMTMMIATNTIIIFPTFPAFLHSFRSHNTNHVTTFPSKIMTEESAKFIVYV